MIDHAGRPTLLLWSLAGMGLRLLAFAAGFAIGSTAGLGWITALSLAASVAFFAIGFGPVFGR